MKQRLSPLDWAFLQMESPTRLSHVAGLWIFRLPKGYRKNFFREYMEGLKDWAVATPPFNLKLGGGLELPNWVVDENFDVNNHVRYAALPKPGSMNQLMELVARIHSHRLERSRPLWEYYMIEGLKGRRVAVYWKVHHAMFDGVSALQAMVGTLSKSPDKETRRAVWQPTEKKKPVAETTGLLGRLGKVTSGLLGQVKTLPELSTAVAKTGLQALNLRESAAPAPFTAPRTPMSQPITSRRSLAVEGFSLSRLKALGKETHATINDLVLAICAGALRRYLGERGQLPQKPLTAWVPVSLRTPGETGGGNQVTITVCSLATDVDDPGDRLEAIKASAKAAKEQVKGQSRQTNSTYTQLLSGLVLLTQELGLTERVAPPSNVIVSNVPGSRVPLYMNGARLVGQYPVSMLIDGQALNITVTSHDDRLDFGLVSCPEAVPELHLIARYMRDALEELEDAAPGMGARDEQGDARPRTRAATGKPRNQLGGLIDAFKAVPADTLGKAIQGEGLNAKAASRLRKSLDKLAGVADKVQSQATAKPDPGREGLNGPDPDLMTAQAPLWNTLMDYYFRLEFDGWDQLPECPSLVIGIHSGGPLTMDAWTVAMAWWRHFEGSRTLHGTAHDVLMNSPGLGRYFRRMGTVSPTRENIAAAFAKGDDLILWPGGEVDAYRTWTKRDKAVLGGRKGFIRLAIREGVPIVPLATVGGHDTLFVLSEGRGIAKALKLKERMRSDVAPITLSIPFGVALHLTPFQHIPLPAKIRTQLLEPIYLDTDPERANDNEYVGKMYTEIEGAIQKGMDALARKRKFPVMG